MTPDLSLCIPSYNGALTIYRAVYSAVQIAGIDLEVVVCDDGSGDDTALAAADAGARVLRLPTNGGAVPALNAAMAAAKGRYLMFHGDDDWLVDGGVNVLVQALDANPAIGFAYGGVKYWGRRSDYVLPPLYNRADYDQHFACLDGFIFRRDAWDKGLRWRDFQHGGALGDWDFVMQMIDTLGYEGSRVDVPVLNYTLAWGRGWEAQQSDGVELLAQFKQLWPTVKATSL